LEAHAQSLLRSCHDCADGGLVVALAEAAMWGKTGFRIECAISGRADAVLFGEHSSRFIVSATEADLTRLQSLAASHSVGLRRLGVVGGARLVWDGVFDLGLSEAEESWSGGLEHAMVGPVEVNAPQAD
jgi:phosphoribosylformylglycinamidine synthase